MKFLRALEGTNAVLTIVPPVLILRNRGIPELPIVFPVNIVFAVKRSDEVQSFLLPRHEGVLHEHCVKLQAWVDAQVSNVLLRVIGEVLPTDADVWVLEDNSERRDNRVFLILLDQ